MFCNWNESNLNRFASIDWRASMVPEAAVIPAPTAYIKIGAVKKLVIEMICNRTNPGSAWSHGDSL